MQATRYAFTSNNPSQVSALLDGVTQRLLISLKELQELSHKKIFSKDEITSIAKRRSDFEHKLNSRGSTPPDYVRYAEYEMNLESLRRKRVKRLGVRTSNHSGQRRIFFILDRATRRFQGDVGLWMQYLKFARKQKSDKKVSQILTSMLRFHPTKAEMWIYAANYAMDERGDMTEARSYMQRGLRFCETEEKLWIEYARLEMIWVARIWARRRILGVDESQENFRRRTKQHADDINGDIVRLPEITEEDVNPTTRITEGMNQEVLENLGTSPALSGAIPMTIFDSAMKQFNQDESLCLRLFDMINGFRDLPCTKRLLDHMMEIVQIFESPAARILFIKHPVLGLSATSPGFPAMFGLCLDRMNSAFSQLSPLTNSHNIRGTRATLCEYILEWLLPYFEEKELDPDLRKVVMTTLRKVWKKFQGDIADDPGGKATEVLRLIGEIQARGLHKIAEPATAWALEMWPNEAQFFSQVT